MRQVLRITLIGLALVALGAQGGGAHAGENRPCPMDLFIQIMDGPACLPKNPHPGCDRDGDGCKTLRDFAIIQNTW